MLVLDTYDFDDKEIASATIAKLIATAGISEVDQEILYLRYHEEWWYKEIADYVGDKYEDRTLTEGAIRHRIKGILERLRTAHNSLTAAVGK